MSDFQQSMGQPGDEREEHELAIGAIGEIFRQTREARGETLADVAYALKMSTRQIEAIEAERFDLLPGAVFIKGFLKNYARHLGLDPEPMVAALRREQPVQAVRLTPVTNATGAVPIGGEDRKLLKPVSIVVLGMVLALAAGWYFDWFSMGDVESVAVRSEQAGFPPATFSEPVDPDAPSIGAGMTVPPPMRDTTPAPESSPSVAVPIEPKSTEGPVVEEVVVPELAIAPPEDVAVTPAESPEATAAEATAAEGAGAEGAASAPGEGRLVFRMEGESWIQVRDSSGASLYTGTGAAGSTRTVQGNPPFAIVVGNAGVVTLEFDGEPVDLKANTSPGGVARMTVR